MTKTVLITGASSGIGKATAQLFQQRGWQVAATMRSPANAGSLATLERVFCPRLDVTDPSSVQQAVQATLEKFGSIDVVVNNAGYGLIGIFELATPEQIEQQFATNVFGVMHVIRAVLPHLRDRQQGIIINVSSIGGRVTFPLYSLYHGTKWALEGFSESLCYELEPFNILVKLIEPGPIKTDFYSRSAVFVDQTDIPAYRALIRRVMPIMERIGTSGSPPEAVAATIYQAATDRTHQMRYPIGGNAGALLGLRKLLPDWAFTQMMRSLLT
ncbi:MAG: SDR family oxidoreductase [Cyanobacteria bacterium]|nr:SDR family oxidoreductase [Cyanobacteriota bacterium]MDW8201323.1 SDR family oxidoreductase [Cyanobacteriota bacterium SKYGB_h_bin112]